MQEGTTGISENSFPAIPIADNQHYQTLIEKLSLRNAAT
jgi:hypothetical protein